MQMTLIRIWKISSATDLLILSHAFSSILLTSVPYIRYGVSLKKSTHPFSGEIQVQGMNVNPARLHTSKSSQSSFKSQFCMHHFWAVKYSPGGGQVMPNMHKVWNRMNRQLGAKLPQEILENHLLHLSPRQKDTSSNSSDKNMLESTRIQLYFTFYAEVLYECHLSHFWVTWWSKYKL